MKKLLLSAVMAVSAFAVVSSVQSHNGCNRCAITEEVGCTPKPICEKQIVVTKNACPVLTCTRQCSYSCPADFKEAGIADNSGKAFADEQEVTRKVSRRYAK